MNKMDVVAFDTLSEDYQKRVAALEADGVIIMHMSTLTEDGVDNVRNIVCLFLFV